MNLSKFLILIFLSLFSSIYAQEIYQSGNGTAESKTEACQIALENAQKEALYQSGINIFSVYEKRERISNYEVKQIINYNLQSSYGFVKTVAKSEKFDFNFQNGMITCKVNGTFDVDTSKLKSQLSALSQKYENISNEEQERANKLEQKNQLLQKYKKLKIALTTEQSFYISENYYCGESLGVSQCKNELKKRVFKKFQKKLARKHNIDEYSIKVNDVELNSDIQIKAINGLSASYSGQVTGKASQVRNPYLDEINSLNAYLGERQIYEKTEEPEDNSPNFLQRTGSTIWNGTTSLFNFLTKKGNKIEYSRSFNEPVNIKEISWNYNISKGRGIDNIPYRTDLKITYGEISWDLEHDKMENYSKPKLMELDYSKYFYTSFGISFWYFPKFLMGLPSFELDYVIPEKGTEFIKISVFWGYNFKKISLFFGFTPFDFAESAEWEANNKSIFFRVGYIF